MFSKESNDKRKLAEVFFIAGLSEENICKYVDSKLNRETGLNPTILYKFPSQDTNVSNDHLNVSFYINVS